MARIRTIKPEFFTDAKIIALTPLARLFYVSLWCEADRHGRLKWDPMTLKYRYLPAEKESAEDLASELVEGGLIRLYEISGQLYADIPGFVRHQVINNRESESSIPPYSDDACVTREARVRDAAYGKEGRKGREGTTPIVPRGTYLEDFERWWDVYPHKVAKDAAYRAWQKAIIRVDNETLVSAVKRYIARKPETISYANPATWLNGGRWQDQPAEGNGDEREWVQCPL